jgi:antitoxin component YwqK of YwqJK toxin-antitoxin module
MVKGGIQIDSQIYQKYNMFDISLICWNNKERRTEKIMLLQPSSTLIKSGENFDFEQLFKINETNIEGYVINKDGFYYLYNCKKNGYCVEIREIKISFGRDRLKVYSYYSGKFEKFYKGNFFKKNEAYYKNDYLHGKYTNYTESQKCAEIEYYKGRKHGKSLEFYEDGSIKTENYYKHNNYDGFYYEYYNNGIKSLERYYRNDKIGIYEGNYTLWDKKGRKTFEATYLNGKIIKKERYNKKGVLYEKIYSDDVNGIMKIEYDDNGNKINETKHYF